MMKKDIENRNDIELLVNTFYQKIMMDEELGYIFREKANINWLTHLPTMVSFWENMVLFTGNYEGNPMNLHRHLHHIAPLNQFHFDKWNQLFLKTLDELFEGEKARLAKERTISISAIIQDKVLLRKQPGSDIY